MRTTLIIWMHADESLRVIAAAWPNPRLQRTRSPPLRSPLNARPFGDSRKVSEASSQESDSNALQLKQAAWKYQPGQLVPSGHGPNEVEGRTTAGVQMPDRRI